MPTDTTKIYEKVVIKEFLKNLNEQEIVSIDYPDPPDGLIKMKNGEIIWIEVTSIYRHNEIAKQLNKRNPDSQPHSECLGTEGDFKEGLIKQLISSIKKKDKKSAYSTFTSQYGKGNLILYIDDPFCDAFVYEQIVQHEGYNEIVLKNFKSIYLCIRAAYSGDFTSERGELKVCSQSYCRNSLISLRSG